MATLGCFRGSPVTSETPSFFLREIFFYPNSHQREISLFPYLRWLLEGLLAKISVHLRGGRSQYPFSDRDLGEPARSAALPLCGLGGGSCSSRGHRAVGLPWAPSSSSRRASKPSQVRVRAHAALMRDCPAVLADPLPPLMSHRYRFLRHRHTKIDPTSSRSSCAPGECLRLIQHECSAEIRKSVLAHHF